MGIEKGNGLIRQSASGLPPSPEWGREVVCCCTAKVKEGEQLAAFSFLSMGTVDSFADEIIQGSVSCLPRKGSLPEGAGSEFTR